ncbi:MAG: peroxidase family protein [Arenibacterium sp.]
MKHGRISDSVVAPSSPFYHGAFGRICSKLTPWHPPQVSPSAADADLEAFFVSFANTNMIEAPGKTPAEIVADDALRQQLDAQFDSDIPAAYTYFGQFVDHDITLDTTPISEAEVDPNRLRNFRTPRLDLDCVYGQGPGDQPFLYDHSGPGFTGKMLTGTVPGTSFPDLLRNSEGRAIIGDMRNDENAIVAQIQLAFILAHNRLVDAAVALGTPAGMPAFAQARRTLIWLYQWIVWKDFIRRVAVDDVFDCALRMKKKCGESGEWRLGLKHIYNWKHQPFMPVEFSVAAYRFGHSLARNSYQTNVSGDAGFNVFFPLFNVHGAASEDLSGFRPLAANRVVQWDWFLHMDSSGGPFPQRTRKIDTKLANALGALRENEDDPGSFDNVLPARNLVRSVRMKLPAGTDVARKFGLKPITLGADEPDALWFYILKEAETLPGANAGQMMGRVGSMIVCATFAGLLKGDGLSWVNQHPHWCPDDDPLLTHILQTDDLKKDAGLSGNPDWSLASVIRLAGLPIDGSSF